MKTADFYKYLEYEKHYSAHTVKSYRSDIEQYLSYSNSSFDDVLTDVFNQEQIRGWIVFLLGTGYTASSVHRKISSLRRYIYFLMREGALQTNPVHHLTLPKKRKQETQFVTEDHMENLLDIVVYSDDFKGQRARLVLEMLYDTGIRLSELLGIRLKDLDFGQKQLKVLGKRNKERIIPITDGLLNLTQHYLTKRRDVVSNNTDYLFVTERGEQAYPKLIYRIVRDHLQQVSSIKKKSPHVIRHSFATHLLNRGADLNAIKELLGHANLSATQIYTHNDISSLRKVYEQAHPRA